MSKKVSVGVSRCLLGDQVRFDGGHKRSRYLTDTLGDYFDWRPVCPEVEAGMSTPRKPIRLVEENSEIRVLGHDGNDYTEALSSVAENRLAGLRKVGIRGFIFKKDSPSCGAFRVKLYRGKQARRDGVGVFAAYIQEHWPNLPVEEEGRLNDARLRENFLQRVFHYDRWQDFLSDAPTVARLMKFHATHKYLFLSHNQEASRQLGRIVAKATTEKLDESLRQYEDLMMSALSRPTSVRKQINTIQHLMGFVKKQISREEKEEFKTLLEQYRNQVVPLITPLTLLRHHLRKSQSEWAKGQQYLDPYPAQLALRSHL